jgi:hypothetical protein
VSADEPLWLVALPAVIIVAALIWVFLMRPPVVVKDSPEFTAAVEYWHPILFANPSATPRAMKRFMNRVRFLAMRQRSEPGYVSPLKRIGRWLGVHLRLIDEATSPGDEKGMPEDVLVAWCAVHRIHGEAALDMDSHEARAWQAANPDALVERMKTWQDKFKQIAGGITVR